MNRKTAPAPLIALVSFIVLFIGSFPIPAFDVVTIFGEVSDANQIISDREIYEVDDTPQGNGLVKIYISKRLKVIEKIIIEGGMRIFDVTALEVVEK